MLALAFCPAVLRSGKEDGNSPYVLPEVLRNTMSKMLLIICYRMSQKEMSVLKVDFLILGLILKRKN